MTPLSTKQLLPKDDSWSTPFAESLLQHLDLQAGLHILDVACGSGIPAFYLAEQVGPSGQVLGLDVNAHQIAYARSIQGSQMPWLRFECADVRALPDTIAQFDRITGNLSVMFFRPDRFDTVKGLIDHLKSGGQIVLTFPSQGTFDSLWALIDRHMVEEGLTVERERFQTYLQERPSIEEGRDWLERLALDRIVAADYPLPVETGTGRDFLEHPLLRRGFLDDVYECFDDQRGAERFMSGIARVLPACLPLIARRGVLAGWNRQAAE
ncbi:hypothetical protein W02_06440 [Nitrospira sp. KM1]|uniref:class I SAM-dependent methyltransferase n=1 Tax=Nitrospira sp. KM1 TaxID=1936990 RepID=UPI0013A73C31|nr:class I SAM-dependent methyltransferase [Nitrospira sp. KM1]BCA53504.1 hypothetical protein W02_06440 [Nitrospira sp. KM1]